MRSTSVAHSQEVNPAGTPFHSPPRQWHQLALYSSSPAGTPFHSPARQPGQHVQEVLPSPVGTAQHLIQPPRPAAEIQRPRAAHVPFKYVRQIAVGEMISLGKLQPRVRLRPLIVGIAVGERQGEPVLLQYEELGVIGQRLSAVTR